MIDKGRHVYLEASYKEFFEPEVHIGAFSSIAGNVTFCGKMNHVWVTHRKAVSSYPFTEHWKLDYFEPSVTRGPIFIGKDVWIGVDVFILDGVTISDGAIVGAKSVVSKNVPPYAVVVGNPAEVKHFRYSPEQIEKLLKIKWWEWTDKEITDRIQDFKDIDIFIEKYGANL